MMKVTRDWLKAFDTVMNYQKSTTPLTFGQVEIDECKAEAREHEAWALEFYPNAARMIEQ